MLPYVVPMIRFHLKVPSVMCANKKLWTREYLGKRLKVKLRHTSYFAQTKRVRKAVRIIALLLRQNSDWCGRGSRKGPQ